MLKLFRLVALLSLTAVGLAGCLGRTRVEDSNADLVRPIHDYQPPPREAYADARISFQRPKTWTVSAVDTGDARIHAVDLRSPENLYARISVVPRAGGMPDEVLEGLRRGHPDLSSEAYTASLAGQSARGHRYKLRLNDVSWRGWVVSCLTGGHEVCFLGQHPRDIPDNLREELNAVMNSLRLNAGAESAGK